MADKDFFEQYVRFSSRPVDRGNVPRRCTVCGVNPSPFEYQKHAGSPYVRKEGGYCCAACAFNMLVQLANEEAREWIARAGT